MIFLNLLQRMIDQPDDLFYILLMSAFYRCMQTSQWQRYQSRGDALITVCKCIGIGAGTSRRSFALNRDCMLLGCFKDQIQEFVMYRRSISYSRSFSTFY